MPCQDYWPPGIKASVPGQALSRRAEHHHPRRPNWCGGHRGPGRGAGGRWWRRTAGVEDTGGNCRGAGRRRQGQQAKVACNSQTQVTQHCRLIQTSTTPEGNCMRHYGITNNIPSHQAAPDGRPPRGLRGLAGLRDDAPSEARGADGERAGRPGGGRRSVGATNNTKPPGPTGGRAAHASGR